VRPPVLAVAVALLLASGSAPPTTRSEGTTMNVKSITANLYVEEIEPSLPFWERLGFTRTAEVPEGDRLGFVILQHGGTQVMYQTRASVAGDAPVLGETPMRGTLLFIEVDDIESVIRNLGDTPLIVPRRTTFYGADEVIVREPAGNVVTFAQFKQGS